MLKIFVTGDNHVGLKYASHGSAAGVLAQKRVDAFRNMVRIANEECCGLFVITGDLFENNRISKKEMQPLLDMLSDFRGTVAVLPGNHDYYEKDAKLWSYFQDIASQKDNIMLMTAYQPYSLSVNGDDVVLYPALCMSKHSAPGENNLGWIKEEPIAKDGTYRIGVAHGAIEGLTIDNEGAYFPMKQDELERSPVDVWLIGHTHVPFPKTITETYSGCGRIFNPGTHVQTDVACNTEGLCFIVQIEEDKSVRAKKVVTGNVRFYREKLALSAGEMEHELNGMLDKFGNDSVVELILSGAVTAEEYEKRTALLDKSLSRFIDGAYDDSELSKLITQELINAEFPETSFSAGLLTELIGEPKEAQMVYDLLTELKEEK